MNICDDNLIHGYARSGNLDGVRFLLSNGISPNSLQNKNKTPLHIAAKYGFDKILESLIACGGNINAVDHKKMTPLHYASYNGKVSCIKILCSKGCLLNERDIRGWTPLHMAYIGRMESSIKLLQELGADQTILDIDLRTPLEASRYFREKTENIFMCYEDPQLVSYFEDSCAICCDTYKGVKFMIECKHVFHLTCILKWMERRETCPMCRKEIE